MRISDWSSDVCSSDLIMHWNAFVDANAAIGAAPTQAHQPAIAGQRLIARAQCRPPRSSRSEERRVGKEWSVRVDLGGRRIIKKKKKNTNNRVDLMKEKKKLTNNIIRN